MKFTKKMTSTGVLFAILGCTSLATTAGTITNWNVDNVVTTPVVDGNGFSYIYDKDVSDNLTGATTNGYVKFTPDDSISPGIEVENNTNPAGEVDNCIIAAGDSTCNGPFQSHKRFKLDRTGLDPIDLVFDVSNGDLPLDNDGLYKVFQKYGNNSGTALDSFTIELGFGIGDDFTSSSVGDRLGFYNFGNDPEDNQFSTSFSSGLFGKADQHHLLDGYFSNESAGFNLIFGEDILKSDGLFGEYDDIFGNWISYDMAPDGYFYDHDGDPETESLLMAHFKDDSDGGKWIMNRAIDSSGEVTSEYYGNAGVVYASVAKIEEALIAMSTGLDLCTVNPNVPCLAGVGSIDDLAKFNVTYSIDQIAFDIPDEGGQFSLRVTAAVPEPGSFALFGLGLIGLFRMKRRAN
jgi:hypothetical protein